MLPDSCEKIERGREGGKEGEGGACQLRGGWQGSEGGGRAAGSANGECSWASGQEPGQSKAPSAE